MDLLGRVLMAGVEEGPDAESFDDGTVRCIAAGVTSSDSSDTGSFLRLTPLAPAASAPSSSFEPSSLELISESVPSTRSSSKTLLGAANVAFSDRVDVNSWISSGGLERCFRAAAAAATAAVADANDCFCVVLEASGCGVADDPREGAAKEGPLRLGDEDLRASSVDDDDVLVIRAVEDARDTGGAVLIASIAAAGDGAVGVTTSVIDEVLPTPLTPSASPGKSGNGFCFDCDVD